MCNTVSTYLWLHFILKNHTKSNLNCNIVGVCAYFVITLLVNVQNSVRILLKYECFSWKPLPLVFISFKKLMSNLKINMLLNLFYIFQLIQTLKLHHNISCCNLYIFGGALFWSFWSSPELTVSTWCELAPSSQRLG